MGDDGVERFRAESRENLRGGFVGVVGGGGGGGGVSRLTPPRVRSR